MRDADPRTDAELLGATAAGDSEALRLLYERHSPWLSVRLMRRCNDSEVVIDVLQDTFLAVWRHAEKWRGDGEVAAWLWGIGIRRLVSRRRGTARPLLELTAEDEAMTPSAEERVLLGVEYGDLAGTLRRLSPEMRAVVQATVLDGLTAKEGGALLGVPTATVKTRLRRAKARMRTDLVEGLT